MCGQPSAGMVCHQLRLTTVTASNDSCHWRKPPVADYTGSPNSLGEVDGVIRQTGK